MDHQEKHHQHHQKEREAAKREQRQYEEREMKSTLPFHPAWLVAVGVGLVILAIVVWTFWIW